MQTLYDTIMDDLNDNAATIFSIPGVTVRNPNDPSDKTYPYGVLFELVNQPESIGTVNGETRTVVGYQLDWYTQDVVDDSSDTLSAFDAGRTLLSEASDYLDDTYALTRTFARLMDPPSQDVVKHTWRGDGVVEGDYTYRR